MTASEPGPVESAGRPKQPRRAARVACVHSIALLACAAACGCAAEAGSAWREGMVRSIVTKQALDATVPLCRPRSRDATPAPDTRVAIVRSRVGKAPYDEAFVLAAGLDVRAGGDVRFDRRDCRLRQPSKPASN